MYILITSLDGFFSAIFIVYLPGFTIIEALFPSRSELEAL